MTPAIVVYLLGMGASAVEYGPNLIPLFFATAVVAAVVSRYLQEHTWQGRSRSRAGRSTTGSR